MGEVYRATDTKLGRDVALKVLPAEMAHDADRLARFRREAKALALLDHPNIVTIHTVEECDGFHFLTMQLVEGQPLDRLIPAGGLPVEQIVEIASGLADALAAAHEKGIMHRDLKPANVMVSNEGRVKVLDFGLAKDVGQTDPADTTLTAASQTQVGVVMGTPAYMSPEQAAGRRLDHRTDIFSMGVVLHEMSTGRRPFEGASLAELVSAILRDTPPSVTEARPDLPSDLARIVRRCLEKDPRHRVQTARDVSNEFRDLSRQISARAVPARTASSRADGVADSGSAGAGGGRWAGLAIAVLPFANLSSDPESEFFADGVTEEIINALAQIKNLPVVARSSAFSFKGRQVDLRTVGATLNAGTVLEGSVRKSGDRVRIVAQLINAADGYQIWSERYDRQLRDIFEVQDEIARTIAERLKVAIGPETAETLVRPETRDLEAYQLYLKGRFHWNKRSADGLQKAIEYFQQAIARDPNYAVAYAGVADAYNLISFRNVMAPHAVMPKAKAAATKSLELDPRRAEAHVSLAYASFTYDRNWPAAGRHFERAETLNPAYVAGHAFYPLYLSSLGRSEESISVAKRALALDPAAAAASHVSAVQLYLARLFEQSAQQCQQTLELDPNYEPAYAVLGQVYALTGRYEEAAVEFEKSVAVTQRSSWALALLGYARARSGARSQAMDIIDEVKAISKSSFVSALCFALVYTGLEEADEAFPWLKNACDERHNRLAYVKVEALWDPLRSDPRFANLLQEFGIEE
jgi:serine/threonine protein kinase/tetratricopeptide (TPR) repeat protein